MIHFKNVNSIKTDKITYILEDQAFSDLSFSAALVTIPIHNNTYNNNTCHNMFSFFNFEVEFNLRSRGRTSVLNLWKIKY